MGSISIYVDPDKIIETTGGRIQTASLAEKNYTPSEYKGKTHANAPDGIG